MASSHLYAPYNTWEGGKADTHCTMPGQDSGAGPGDENVGERDLRTWEQAGSLLQAALGVQAKAALESSPG